jgi:hypothetical protein
MHKVKPVVSITPTDKRFRLVDLGKSPTIRDDQQLGFSVLGTVDKLYPRRSACTIVLDGCALSGSRELTRPTAPGQHLGLPAGFRPRLFATGRGAV